MHVNSFCEEFSQGMSLVMAEVSQSLRSGRSPRTMPLLKRPEQAQAGYEEIGEMPAISDLPRIPARIMPGYQDTLATADCHREDNRETFVCHSIQAN